MDANHDDEIQMRRSLYYKMRNSKFSRCLEPTMTCKNKAIRAHSIQNSRVLDLLSDNGHVTSFALKVDNNTGPQPTLELIGRNNASTFLGLCSEHDNKIFYDIDNEELDTTNAKHLFLLAYRSIYRELYTTMDTASKIQCSYLELCKQGLDSEEVLSPLGIFATNRLLTSYGTWLYKSEYDIAFLNNDYTFPKHTTLVFNNQKPTIAVSSLFSIDNTGVQNESLRTVVNIIPTSADKTICVISYRATDEDAVHIALNRVLQSTGHHQLYEISRLVLNHCENFVLSPAFVAGWDEQKKKTITEYFTKTILQNDMSFESPDLRPLRNSLKALSTPLQETI
jgi:hypothetical protein